MADSSPLQDLLSDTNLHVPRAEYQIFPARDPFQARRMIPPQAQYFKLFSYLSEDIKAAVLSYVADAPFETMPQNYPRSSLTHTLPAVNRQFRTLCNGNLFWKDAIVRMTQQEPDLWKPALRSLWLGGGSGRIQRKDAAAVDAKTPETIQELVECTHQALLEHQPAISSYKSIYETIVNQDLRYKGPLFFMPGQIALGQVYSLHFFEPRYRLLIAQVMRDQPDEARNGGPLAAPVYFLHAHQAPLQPTTPAVLVQVLQCLLYPDGRADVVLLPVHYVWLERIWVRPDQGHLYYAQALKMGRAVTQQMKRLQRQEALANVMDRLAGELAQDAAAGGGGGSSESD